MENLTVVSSLFWPWILANLSIVSISGVCETFQIDALTVYQRQASVQFVEKKFDIFKFTDGIGDISDLSSVVAGVTRNSPDHIVAVVSSLVNLMKDQVENLQKLGIPAVSLSDVKDGEARAIKEGRFKAVYGTPEVWLKVERWRKMLSSEMYSSKVCAIAVDEAHVIKQW